MQVGCTARTHGTGRLKLTLPQVYANASVYPNLMCLDFVSSGLLSRHKVKKSPPVTMELWSSTEL